MTGFAPAAALWSLLPQDAPSQASGTVATMAANRFVPGVMREACGIDPERPLTVQRAFSRCGHHGVDVKLLIIEDDVKIAAAIKRGLEAEGFTVETAVDGNEGLWFATE